MDPAAYQAMQMQLNMQQADNGMMQQLRANYPQENVLLQPVTRFFRPPTILSQSVIMEGTNFLDVWSTQTWIYSLCRHKFIIPDAVDQNAIDHALKWRHPGLALRRASPEILRRVFTMNNSSEDIIREVWLAAPGWTSPENVQESNYRLMNVRMAFPPAPVSGHNGMFLSNLLPTQPQLPLSGHSNWQSRVPLMPNQQLQMSTPMMAETNSRNLLAPSGNIPENGFITHPSQQTFLNTPPHLPTDINSHSSRNHLTDWVPQSNLTPPVTSGPLLSNKIQSGEQDVIINGPSQLQHPYTNQPRPQLGRDARTSGPSFLVDTIVETHQVAKSHQSSNSQELQSSEPGPSSQTLSAASIAAASFITGNISKQQVPHHSRTAKEFAEDYVVVKLESESPTKVKLEPTDTPTPLPMGQIKSAGSAQPRGQNSGGDNSEGPLKPIQASASAQQQAEELGANFFDNFLQANTNTSGPVQPKPEESVDEYFNEANQETPNESKPAEQQAQDFGIGASDAFMGAEWLPNEDGLYGNGFDFDANMAGFPANHVDFNNYNL